ncbi:AraC family transcriptional regulator [soil metagenome]
MPQEFEGGNYEGAILGDRFGLSHAPTILARASSVAPIGFTRLKSDGRSASFSKDAPLENAYIFHVQLQSAAMNMWLDGKCWLATTKTPGTTFLYDLRRSINAEIHSSFDNIRFYISQASLDELAYEQGLRPAEALVSPSLGSDDRVMFGLANALVDQVERADERSALFIDHIALAFFAHVMGTYGDTAIPDDLTSGGLSPRQLRRALDLLSAHLSDDPSVADLARECGLSSGYFSRAFRQTTGVTPHQWLIRRRIERARQLLLGNRLSLADIAVVCGFVDQSHFTRVFAKHEGDSPGRWRRKHL